LDRPHYIPTESAAKLPADRFLQDNDVLMANIAEGTLGRLTFVNNAEPDWTVDGQVMIIRSTNQNEVLGKWIYYYLFSSRGQEQILGQRTGMPFASKRGQTHIYPTQINKIQIPVPPIHAQDQIVRKLDSVVEECSAMREDLNNTVAALDEVRFGALSNVLRESH
jgi:restriction endonuclease S subunit